MSSQAFRFDSLRFAPRKPRRLPLLRFALGLIGVVLLCLLLVFGFFVGAAMLGIGFGAKKLLSKKKPAPARAVDIGKSGVIEGEYRVVR